MAKPSPLVVVLEGGLTRADLAGERKLHRIAAWFGAGRGGPRLEAPDPDTVPLDPHTAAFVRAQAEERQVLVVGDLPQSVLEILVHRAHTHAVPVSAPIGAGRLKVVQDALADQPYTLLSVDGQEPSLQRSAQEIVPGVAAPRPFPLRAVRPHHWVKNLLVFVPILAGHRWDEAPLWLFAVLAFVAFCLASSAVYLTNDLFDIDDDRRHPVKRLRPLASGELRPTMAVALAVTMLAAGAVLSIQVQILPVLAVYAVASLAYSLKLKTVPGIDLFCLVGLYTLRLLAGGMATGIAVSGWLLAYGACVFASLALAKRCAELAGAGAGTLPLPQRRGYQLKDRQTLSLAGRGAAVASGGVLALYLQEAQAVALYDRPGWLILAGAVVLAWLLRVWHLVGMNRLQSDPIVFALRDFFSLSAGASVIALLVLAAKG